MGFFDTNNKKTVEKTVREISYTGYEYKSTLSTFDFSPYIYKFKDEELLSNILWKFVRQGVDFSLHMDFITNMFTSICLGKTTEEAKGVFENFFDLYMENQEIFLINNSFDKIINVFDDKKIALEYFRFLLKSENILDNSNPQNLSKLIDYVSEARRFYVDDRALLNSAISLVRNFDPVLLKYGDIEDVEKIINARLSQDKRASGIYDVDIATLAELNAKLDEILSSGNGLDTLIQSSEKQVEIMRKELARFKEEIKQVKIKELSELQKKSNQIIKNFTSSYLELMEQQRSSLVDEKDLLIQDVNAVIEKRKAELLSIADNVGKRITIELGRVTNVTNESVKRLKDFVDRNEVIKRMISEAKSNDDLMDALAQVIQASNQAGVAIPIDADKIQIPRASDVFVTPRIITPQSQIQVPNVAVITEPERQVDQKVNYFFDERIPFKDRFAHLMELKRKDEQENGTIYHEKFDDVAKIFMIGKKPPYMIGPSGCGKTYLVENQFSKLFGIKIITDSYITFEQAVIGYTNSGNGGYVPTNFYRCYKYGDTYCLDEIDNGVANATIILNKFMGNSNTSFTFPDGITIQRHPNFRIITAGNTKGHGKTLAHNTRQKMDEATLQRMTPIELGYDNRIECRILKDKYPDWYDFSVNFRAAVESIQSDSGEEINTMGTFTTRDAEMVKTYKDQGVFEDDKIMLYEIIESKDEDYLSRIGDHMQSHSSNFKTNGGRKLLNLYLETCAKKREKVKCKTL